MVQRQPPSKLGIDEPPSRNGLSPLLFGIGTVVGVDPVQPAVAKPLLQGLAGVRTPARAVCDNDTGSVGLPHRLRAAFDQEAVPRLALAQCALQKMLCGRLLQRPEDASDAAIVVVDRSVLDIEPSLFEAAVPEHRVLLTDQPSRPPGHSSRQIVGEHTARSSEGLEGRLSQCQRAMLPKQFGEAVVVEVDRLRAPHEAHHARRHEHEVDDRLQALRPARDRS